MEKRMQTILDLCQKLPITADVGCDHGYISLELLKQNKTDYIIATDISKPSLQKAIDLLNQKGFKDKFCARVGDGLSVIKSDESIDQVVIAGMGGQEIIHILQEFKGKNMLKNIVLQPMNQIKQLREYLTDNGFKINRDIIVKEGEKFYHILGVNLGRQKLNMLELGFGANIEDCKTEDFKLWLKQKQFKIKRILKGMPKDNPKAEMFEKWLKNMEQIKQIIN